MSTHNICFYGEIRKISILFGCGKESYLELYGLHILFVLRFYGPVNPMGSC